MSSKYIADRFLPDKAIDVLDESGARVRLESRRLPIGLRSLMYELQNAIRDKEDAVKRHDFGAAKQFLDHEMEVRTHMRIMKQSSLTQELRGIIRRDVDMVLENDVANVVSNWTGIPVTKISGSESERLLQMEDILHERIIGQEDAVTAVSKAIRRARVGLRNPNRPIASFIFAGPTGVGKTELTKALSDYMFGSEESMIRLDMSEYMEKHTVAKLIGSPPGYVGYNEGGQLTEAVRSKPYSVVLLDEVEKAHPDVFNLMLQILDDGRLTDSKGRLIDFTNTLIVMTTNLGSKIIERESGIKAKTQQEGSGLKLTTNEGIFGWEPAQEVVQDSKVRDKVKKLVNDELKNFFRPEFLNRIDEIIVFSHLTRRDLWEICELMVKSLVNRLKDKEINLIVRKPVQALLTDEGYDPLYGARPLRRAIMHYLEDDLAEKCLSQTLYPNTKIIVDRKTLEQKRKEEKLMVGSTQQEMTQSKANLFDDLDTSFSDYRESETYTNELKIEIDFSEVDPKLLNGEAEENEKTLELEENNKVTIEGFSTIAEKLRGLLISSSSEDQESNELNEENDSNENIEKESETETKKSENKKSSESTESESSSEDKPKRNRFGLLKRIAAAIFGKIPRFR